MAHWSSCCSVRIRYSFLVLAKNISHWLVSGLAGGVGVAAAGVYAGASGERHTGHLVLSLLLGTPIMSLVGSIAVALTVGLGSRGLILAVITLPMSVPVLIFGTLAVQSTLNSQSPLGYLSLDAGHALGFGESGPIWPRVRRLKISVN